MFDADCLRRYLREGWYPTGFPISRHSMNPSSALLRAMMMQVLSALVCVGGLCDCCGAEHRAFDWREIQHATARTRAITRAGPLTKI